MDFKWIETKRTRNLKERGLDCINVAEVFEGPTFTYEDERFDYPERR
jgi:uncharacterized DUF497 family protein